MRKRSTPIRRAALKVLLWISSSIAALLGAILVGMQWLGWTFP